MATERDPRLQQARDLIRSKNRDQARELLIEVLRENPNNTDALYMFAHTSSLEEAEKALQRLLKIEPDHVQAAAALQKVQQRSVEKLASHLSASTSQAKSPLSQKQKEIQKEKLKEKSQASERPPKSEEKPQPRERRPRPQKEAKSEGGGSSFLGIVIILLLVVVIVVGGGYAFMVYSDSQDSEGDPTTAAEVPDSSGSVTNTVAPSRTPFQSIVDANPPTWTPVPSNTPLPTRTPAPTSTPHPTRTPHPTITPTPIEVQEITIDAPTLSRLYDDYTALIGQVNRAEDSSQLDTLEEAFAALEESITATEYQDDRRLNREHPDWVEFLDEFVILLEKAGGFISAQQAMLGNSSDANAEEVETQRQALLTQDTIMRGKLSGVVSNATATAQAQDPSTPTPESAE